MNLLLWICVTLFALGLLLLARAVKNAPLGYEDRAGFHFGGESGLVPATIKAEPRDLPRTRPLRASQGRLVEIAA